MTTRTACPHVAGLAAYLIKLKKLSGAQQITARIKDLASKGNIQGLKGNTVNALAYNGIVVEPGESNRQDEKAEELRKNWKPDESCEECRRRMKSEES